MLTPSYDDLYEIFNRKGYAFFRDGYYNLNLVGVRSENSMSNRFDDMLVCAYINADGHRVAEYYPCTTDPGSYYLMNPLNKRGTLIMVPGQYRGVYTIGIHGRSGSSPYEALEQVGDMVYVRDGDRNVHLDFSLYRDPIKFKSNKIAGNFKTNIHRASRWKIVQLIERYSAGCQVIQSPSDFDRLISLAHAQVRYGHGNKFSYSLIEEIDL